jgi:oligopeptidase B
MATAAKCDPPRKIPDPPKAHKRPEVVQFGSQGSVCDEYRWMSNRKDADFATYLAAENAYAAAIAELNRAAIEKLKREVWQRYPEQFESLPLAESLAQPFSYFYAYREGYRHPFYYRLNRKSWEKELLLDVNALVAGDDSKIPARLCTGDGRPRAQKVSSNFDVSSVQPSDDQKMLSYCVDSRGDEHYDLRVKDLATGKEVPHSIGPINWVYFWSEDWVYYLVADAAERLAEIRRCRVRPGDSEAKPALVHRCEDPTFELSLSRSRDRHYFFAQAQSTDSTEIHYFTHPDARTRLLVEARPGRKCEARWHEGNFILRTNEDGATNYKLVIVKGDGSAGRRELLPHDPRRLLDDVQETASHLLVGFTQEGHKKVMVIPYAAGNYDVKSAWLVELPMVSVLRASLYGCGRVLLSSAPPGKPGVLFIYDLAKRQALAASAEPMRRIDRSLYETAELLADNDGTKVPLTVVFRRDLLKKNGTNPAYLTGYSAYGCDIDTTFDSSLLCLLDRGFVCAYAHARGGNYLGEAWAEAGRLLNKKNSFRDFIACGEFLIKEGYANPKALVCEGMSAGGLLVAASMVMRPDLFAAVVANVPFVDVLGTMSDPTIPLTVMEWKQWGNPNDPQHFEYMKSYSPYENLKAAAYPNVLVTAGFNDPRVQCWEPAKFVARLRDRSTSGSTIVLKTGEDWGHFGPAAFDDVLAEKAFKFAFILKACGIDA